MTEFGLLKNIEIRKVWASEPGNFTPWLAENISQISKLLGKDLEVIQTEFPVGGFSADIVANDLSTSRKVVIENQFGVSDHKHLGQVLLYCAGIKATCMVWIAEEFKDEHRQAFEWLNTNTINGIEFYAIELSVIQIDDSKPVPIFKVIESPITKSDSNEKYATELTETQDAYRKYFQSLIDDLRNVHKFTNAKAGQPQNWYSFASENSSVYKYGTSFSLNDRVRAEIYIDCGDKSKNKELFDLLISEMDEIHKRFGCELDWEKLDEKRACRIAIYRDGSISNDTETLAEIHTWMVENLLKFKQVFPSYIKKYLSVISN